MAIALDELTRRTRTRQARRRLAELSLRPPGPLRNWPGRGPRRRPDFWKDQAEAQKILQRRRRLEEIAT